MAEFTPAVVVYDAATLAQQTNEEMEARFEGWAPAPGGLFDWLNKADSRIKSMVANQGAVTSEAVFKRFGETIAKVPPILAAPASVYSTWTAIDEDGHEIQDGTEVNIAVDGDESKGFAVVGDYTIAPGDTSTAAGEVLLQAIEPGAAGNELSADPKPISSRTAFVDTITLEGTTSGGVDEEAEDAYLNRLVEELQTLTTSLVLTRDFEIDARAVAGIERAICIPGYDAETETENVPLSFTTISIDAAGLAPSGPVREALQVRQAEKTISGVNNFVDVPTYTKVHAYATFTVLPGFEPADVLVALQARLDAYLSPANFATPTGTTDPGNSAGWEVKKAVYRNEVIADLDRVGGVDRIVNLLLAGGTGKAFTVAAATDKFTSAAHGLANGDPVVLRAGLIPGAPLATSTVYFVRDVEASAFKLAATEGGAAINVTTDGAGSAVKFGSADVALAGVAPLTEPGEIVAAAV